MNPNLPQSQESSSAATESTGADLSRRHFIKRLQKVAIVAPVVATIMLKTPKAKAAVEYS